MLGSYHTELAAYAGLRSGDPRSRRSPSIALGAFYGGCDVVLSPSPATDAALAQLGIAAARIGRWDRGVDLARFDPALRDDRHASRASSNVLYAGRLTKEKSVDLLADAFVAARRRDPRLHLVLAGGGPEEPVPARAARRARDLPRLARGRRPRRAPTRAPTRSCSRARPTPSAR